MAAQSISLEKLTPDQPLIGGRSDLGYRIERLAAGPSAGVVCVRLNCGSKTVDVIPTRGMGIWQAWHQGHRFGWDSPVQGPVHPGFVPVMAPDGLGWLEGFDELLVRCGLASNGAPEFDEVGRLRWPLHGRIANLAASDVSVELDEAQGTIAVSGIVRETAFHFRNLELHSTTSLMADRPEIRITDRITNRSGRPVEFQILYHVNFGKPVLGPGSQVLAPIRCVAPRDATAAAAIHSWNQIEAPDASFSEQVYFMELTGDTNHRSMAVLSNADGTLAASLEFDLSTLPCFTLWKNTVSLADGYVAGLEPGTNFPNPRGFEAERGRTVSLRPDESIEFSLLLGMLVDRSSIQSAISRVQALQRPSFDVEEQPLAKWSPVA